MCGRSINGGGGGSKLTPARYCVVSQTIPAGGIIPSDAIGYCEITGGHEFLKFAVPFGQVKGFVGSRATHRIDKNSLLLWQHVDNTAPYPVEKDEIEIAFAPEQLKGVDLPDQLFAGDRLLLQIGETDSSNGLLYHELGPFTASKVAYSAGDDGKSLIDELRLIVKKRSRYYHDLMSLKRGEGLELVHVGRAS